MKDWKGMAKAHGLEIAGSDLNRLEQSLSGLEDTLRPLFKSLTFDVEPVTEFHMDGDGE